MKLVRENIEFKRGINPKKGLELGEYAKKWKPIDWDSLPAGLYKIFNGDDYIDEAAHIEIKDMGLIFTKLENIVYETLKTMIGFPYSGSLDQFLTEY